VADDDLCDGPHSVSPAAAVRRFARSWRPVADRLETLARELIPLERPAVACRDATRRRSEPRHGACSPARARTAVIRTTRRKIVRSRGARYTGARPGRTITREPVSPPWVRFPPESRSRHVAARLVRGSRMSQRSRAPTLRSRRHLLMALAAVITAAACELQSPTGPPVTSKDPGSLGNPPNFPRHCSSARRSLAVRSLPVSASCSSEPASSSKPCSPGDRAGAAVQQRLLRVPATKRP